MGEGERDADEHKRRTGRLKMYDVDRNTEDEDRHKGRKLGWGWGGCRGREADKD